MYRDKACADCGAIFTPLSGSHKRCAPCGAVAQNANWNKKKPYASSTRPPIKCRQCEVSVPDRRGSVRREFCSRACSLVWYRENPVLGPWLSDVKITLVPRSRLCEFCDVSFWMTSKARRFCSTWCAEAANGRRVFCQSIWPDLCRRCGKCYIGRRENQQYCSNRCVVRAQKNRRHHLERAAIRTGEMFTLREIAERDGWRCHLCHKKVPDREYAARDRDPTMDHLIPLSDGGTHTRVNVALAHNRCNWERSTNGPAQLRLVA